MAGNVESRLIPGNVFRTTATNEHGKKEEIGVSAVFVDPRRRVFALCTVRHEGVSKWSSPPEVCSAARLLLCTDAVKEITGPKAPPVALELQIVREYIKQAGGKKDYHRESKFFDQFWKWHTGGRTNQAQAGRSLHDPQPQHQHQQEVLQQARRLSANYR